MIKIRGYSDDIIALYGDIDEEWYLQDDEKGDLIAFSEGTVLRINFISGVWRIFLVVKGLGYVGNEQAPEGDDNNRTDVATVHGAGYAVHGRAILFAIPKKG